MLDPVVSARASRANHGIAFPINQPVDRFGGELGKETGTRTIRIEYDGTSTTWTSHLPAVGAAHPVAAWLTFKSYQLSQLSSVGDRADLVLNYAQDSFTVTPTVIPDDEISENSSIMEIDITRHPDFATAQATWTGKSMKDFYNPAQRRIFIEDVVPDEYIDENGKTVESSAAGETVPESIKGMDKYVVGSGTVTVVEYSASEPSSIIEDVGKRSVPTGYPGTADNWLIASARKVRRGAWWTKEYVYQFSAKDIPVEVYANL